jgi:acetyl esterase/lipase
MRSRVAAVAITSAVVVLVAGAGALSAADTTPVAGVQVTNDIVYRTVDGEPQLLDAYVPTTDTVKRPVILLVHGGAWRGGDKTNFVGDANRLAQLGYVAFSVNYRLAPAHPYPAAVDDVQAAVRWIRAPAQVKTYRIDPKRIGALGSSAGGHLVGMLATLGQGARTKGARIRAAVSWSGPMDFNLWPLTTPTPDDIVHSVLDFLGCTSQPESCPNANRASPINHIDRSDAPMLLINSDHELIPLDHATTMDTALQRAGVPDQLIVLRGEAHAQYFADQVWDETVSFLRRYVGKPPSRAAA